MYDEKNEHGAHSILMAICAAAAILAIAAGAKIVLDHIDGGNSSTSAKDACENKEGMDALNKAGVFGESANNCEIQGE